MVMWLFRTEPCPSVVFQEVVRTVLQSDLDGSTKFLDSLLTQLNWAFSEFVSMLQEVYMSQNPTCGSYMEDVHMVTI